MYSPGYISRTIYKRINWMSKFVAPRLTGAMFSMLWNRCNTSHRNQGRTGGRCRCRLGCPVGPGAQDSIEHYSCCPMVKEFGRRKLRMDPQHINLHLLTLSQPQHWTKEFATKAGLLIYATYRVIHSTPQETPLTGEQTFDRMETFLFRGADGHEWTRTFLDSIFCSEDSGSRDTRSHPPKDSRKNYTNANFRSQGGSRTGKASTKQQRRGKAGIKNKRYREDRRKVQETIKVRSHTKKTEVRDKSRGPDQNRNKVRNE